MDKFNITFYLSDRCRFIILYSLFLRLAAVTDNLRDELQDLHHAQPQPEPGGAPQVREEVWPAEGGIVDAPGQHRGVQAEDDGGGAAVWFGGRQELAGGDLG